MATVQADIVDPALRALGIVATGETPSNSERDDAFQALNQMIGEWNAQAMPIYQETVESIAMIGAASYVLPTRPVKIQGASVIGSNGHAKGLDVVDATRWAAYERKGDSGAYGEVLFYDASLATPSIYIAPKPNGGSLQLISLRPLQEFANLAATVTLPPGYLAALKFNLAVRIAPEYGRDPAVVRDQANDALTSIIGLNTVVHGQPQPPSQQPAQ